ncbi:MAG: LD-carboxypeptidase [Prevotellaceae bacterium]|jgi:muramoyltetrapeptide carboxypeptidase|nr:LD-carboxypeptidase [Prevotellaceae bacterium]
MTDTDRNPNSNAKFIRPASLRQGDTVGICAPARKVSSDEIRQAMQTMELWGLRVKLGKNLVAEHNLFACADEQRAADLQTLIDDTDVRAVFFARGGYGSARLLQKINFSGLRTSPKWLVGYSDTTAFHLALYRLGVESLHAAMPFKFSDTASVESLHTALFGQNIGREFAPHELNVEGVAAGRLTGGNLSIIYSLQATPYALLPDDAVLFVEDVDEYLYHLDRMALNLALSGKLGKIKALLVGGMTNMKDNAAPYGKSAYEIIYEHVRPLNIPVAFGFPAGHQTPNMALSLGRKVQLTVNSERAELRYL